MFYFKYIKNQIKKKRKQSQMSYFEPPQITGFLWVLSNTRGLRKYYIDMWEEAKLHETKPITEAATDVILKLQKFREAVIFPSPNDESEDIDENSNESDEESDEKDISAEKFCEKTELTDPILYFISLLNNDDGLREKEFDLWKKASNIITSSLEENPHGRPSDKAKSIASAATNVALALLTFKDTVYPPLPKNEEDNKDSDESEDEK